MRYSIVLAASIFTGIFTVDTPKSTEGGTIRPCQSSPFPQRERCALDPVVDPWNTLLMASQTRLDGPQTYLCRRPFAPHFNSFFAFSYQLWLCWTIPKPSPPHHPSSCPSDPVGKPYRVALRTIRRMVSIIGHGSEPGLSNRFFLDLGKSLEFWSECLTFWNEWLSFWNKWLIFWDCL